MTDTRKLCEELNWEEKNYFITLTKFNSLGLEGVKFTLINDIRAETPDGRIHEGIIFDVSGSELCKSIKLTKPQFLFFSKLINEISQGDSITFTNIKKNAHKQLTFNVKVDKHKQETTITPKEISNDSNNTRSVSSVSQCGVVSTEIIGGQTEVTQVAIRPQQEGRSREWNEVVEAARDSSPGDKENNRGVKEPMTPETKKSFLDKTKEEKVAYLLKAVKQFSEYKVVNPSNSIQEQPLSSFSLSFDAEGRPGINNISNFHNIIQSKSVYPHSQKLFRSFYNLYYECYLEYLGDLDVTFNTFDMAHMKTINGYYETFKINWGKVSKS